jgi:hypothetical protein
MAPLGNPPGHPLTDRTESARLASCGAWRRSTWLLFVAGAFAAYGAEDANGEHAGGGECDGVEVNFRHAPVEGDGLVGEGERQSDGGFGVDEAELARRPRCGSGGGSRRSVPPRSGAPRRTSLRADRAVRTEERDHRARRHFDAMMDRPEHAFDAQRRFIANASHELRTPLAVAGTAIDVVLAKPDRRPDQLGPWPATSERPYTEPNDSSTDSR